MRLIYELSDRRSPQIRYAAFLKHSTGHAFECLGWLCPDTLIFLPFETPILTLCLLAPRNRWRGNSCFEAQASSKYGTFAIYVRWLLGWRYISSLRSADESQLGRNSCSLLRFCLIGSCHIGVSKRFSRSISLAVYCLEICSPREYWNLSRPSISIWNQITVVLLTPLVNEAKWGRLLIIIYLS